MLLSAARNLLSVDARKRPLISRKMREYFGIGARALRLIGLAGPAWRYWLHAREPLIHIHHAPKRMARRHGYFSANICGATSWPIERARRFLRYRLNGGEWHDLRRDGESAPWPLFLIELSPDRLLAGSNRVEIEAAVYGRKPETASVEFEYDPSPVRLPIHIDWSNAELDVGEGYWETFEANGEWRVRPKLGYEGYDRILVLAGAFAEGRRVETDVIFRYNSSTDYGFGLLPLWGGRPDDEGVNPRRGWSFGLAWYWFRYRGAGAEFSYRYGKDPYNWVASYRNLNLERDVRYFVITESWPESDAAGNHLRYRCRMKWWKEGTPEPEEWIEVADDKGAPLPPGEYGVAFIAYRCQVDYGPVVIKSLERD